MQRSRFINPKSRDCLRDMYCPLYHTQSEASLCKQGSLEAPLCKQVPREAPLCKQVSNAEPCCDWADDSILRGEVRSVYPWIERLDDEYDADLVIDRRLSDCERSATPDMTSSRARIQASSEGCNGSLSRNDLFFPIELSSVRSFSAGFSDFELDEETDRGRNHYWNSPVSSFEDPVTDLNVQLHKNEDIAIKLSKPNAMKTKVWKAGSNSIEKNAELKTDAQEIDEQNEVGQVRRGFRRRFKIRHRSNNVENTAEEYRRSSFSRRYLSLGRRTTMG